MPGRHNDSDVNNNGGQQQANRSSDAVQRQSQSSTTRRAEEGSNVERETPSREESQSSDGDATYRGHKPPANQKR